MPDRPDVFESFDVPLASRPRSNPWSTDERGNLTYRPDYELLEQVAGIPLAAGSGAESGRLAKAIDAWLAWELRRAGFGDDEVWPRATRPRVLPRDLAEYLAGLSSRERAAATEQILRNKRVGPSDARVLGRAYVKQVDVLIAQWSRGPELLVSTKTMASSFRKNLPNRFEEAYGDAANLRGRFPMVSMGFLFLLRSTAADEAGTLDRAIDMLRKLQDNQDGYDACCLVLAQWASTTEFSGVVVRNDLVPPDVRADRFLAMLIGAVLANTPIDMHVMARGVREHRELPLEEAQEAADPT